jgi:hypothetical protein
MSRTSRRLALRTALGSPSIVAVALAAGASAFGCNLVLGLDAYYDCPGDSRCPAPDAGTGGEAPSCSTPAECPGGDDCTSPICTGGKCGLAAKPDGTACMADEGAGFRCVGGACACPSENACGAACVDKQTDPAHCGACDSPCPTGVACVSGACDCPGGGIVCDGACVDAQTSVAHCGSCDHACTVAGATCDLGNCLCPGGGTECSGSCVDTDTDLANCGQCGKACTATGATCEAGMCVCPGGGTDCSGACVDTNTDGTNCGTCGTACEASLQGSVCTGGMCECPGALTACSGVCLDTATDPLNCGACGHDCLGGGCQSGICQPVVLAMGETNPTDIAVSSTHVYWINPGALSGAVRRVPTGGGTATTVAGNQTAPAHLAIDGSNVYWTYTTGIRKAPLAGGAVSLVTSWASGPVPTGLASDGNDVYWCMDNGDIRRVPVGGGAQSLLISAVTPGGLTTDTTHFYWGDYDGVYKRPKPDNTSFVWLTNQQQSDVHVLDVHAGQIYFGLFNTVSRMSTSGEPISTVDTSTSGASAVAADDTYVYWSTAGGTLRRALAVGNGAVDLAVGATRVAVDSTYVYWTNAGSGQILRAVK